MFSKNIKIKKTPPGPVSSCPDQPIKNSLPGWQERRPKFLSYDFTPFEPEALNMLVLNLFCFQQCRTCHHILINFAQGCIKNISK